MKQLLVILFAVAVVLAVPPTTSQSVQYENLGITKTISNAAAYDTIGGTDSLVLATLNTKGTAQWVLYRDALTGGGTDSLAIQVNLLYLNESGVEMYRSNTDTITAAAGEEIVLPVVTAPLTSVQLKCLSGTGGVVILNRIYFTQRRMVDFTATDKIRP